MLPSLQGHQRDEIRQDMWTCQGCLAQRKDVIEARPYCITSREAAPAASGTRWSREHMKYYFKEPQGYTQTRDRNRLTNNVRRSFGNRPPGHYWPVVHFPWNSTTFLPLKRQSLPQGINLEYYKMSIQFLNVLTDHCNLGKILCTW